MRGFVNAVDWRKFNKTMCIISIVLIISQFLEHKIDWSVIAMIPLIGFLFLAKAYMDYIITIPKPILTLKEIRLKKLKKLKKW
jgi:hypothetical protein